MHRTLWRGAQCHFLSSVVVILAGRSKKETGKKLELFAVGDDDLNIYAFSGSSTVFIKKFEEDYNTKHQPMLENYRSTRHIIEAANAVIVLTRDRLKADHAIFIDRIRTTEPAGGGWQRRDPVSQGRVQVIPAGRATQPKPTWPWTSTSGSASWIINGTGPRPTLGHAGGHERRLPRTGQGDTDGPGGLTA